MDDAQHSDRRNGRRDDMSMDMSGVWERGKLDSSYSGEGRALDVIRKTGRMSRGEVGWMSDDR